MFKLFRDFRIRDKLIVSFVALFIPFVTLGSVFVYSQLKDAIEVNIESELNNTTTSILNLVRTAAAVSIKNHLRAIAEKNCEIVSRFHRRYVRGEITREEFNRDVRNILLSQRIGKTGYIYCLDSQGTAVLHPNAGVESVNFIEREFVQAQIREKEGYLEYLWNNPGEDQMRPKALYMVYFEPLDWIISVSTYRDEFKSLINVEDFRDSVLSLRFGKTGYSYVTDTMGNVVLHPTIEGLNVFDELRTRAGFFQEMLDRRTGKIVYDWQNPGEKKQRKKLVIFNFIPEYSWIVASSCYLDEIFAPLYSVRNLIAVALLGTLVLGLALTVWISASITRPLKGLMATVAAGTDGDLTVRMVQPSRDELGQLARHFNVFMDRLEQETRVRSRMEEKLRESKARLQTTFESLPVDLFCLDLEGRYELQNSRSTARWGSVLGKRQEDLAVSDETLKIWQDQSRRAFSGETVQREISYVENGEKRFYFSILSPIQDQSGIRGVLGITMDITTHKRAEAALVREKEQFRLLLEASPLGISLNQADGTLEYVNPKFMEIFGYTREDIRTVREWLARAFPDRAYRRSANDAWMESCRKMNAGSALPLVFTATCKTGTEKVVQCRPVIMDGGQQLVLYEDITDKRRLESKLQQTQKMEAIGTLAGGIAHDFNNILSAIIGFSELSLMNLEKRSRLENNLKRILSAADRAKNLIKQILTFSQHSEQERLPVMVKPIVSEALNLLRASLPTTIDIHQALHSDAVSLADPTQIHQILMNLCTNAAHSMAEQGGILDVNLVDADLDGAFTSRHPELGPGPYVRLSVSDTGHGMDPATMEMIFDPFFTTKQRGKGTGMGLAVVHGIVIGHGGAITVYSEPGSGSTFNVFLPTCPEQPEEDGVSTDDLSGGSERILFVDDEEFQTDIGREILELLGYRVTTATCSTDALDLFRTDPDRFDLVISDMTMPKMPGDVLAGEIMTVRPGIPIIICTGYSERITEQKARAMGIKGFAMKPIVMKDIARLVRKVLDEV